MTNLRVVEKEQSRSCILQTQLMQIELVTMTFQH